MDRGQQRTSLRFYRTSRRRVGRYRGWPGPGALSQCSIDRVAEREIARARAHSGGGTELARAEGTPGGVAPEGLSTNGGERWEVLGGNLPSNQVSDLQFEPRDQMLVISTYGRGIWAIDVSTIK